METIVAPLTLTPDTDASQLGTPRNTQAELTYVLDTSVLLSDPSAIFRFAEHDIVLPVVVVSELEAKRNDPEIGYFARQALRNLDELRMKHGRNVTKPSPTTPWS